VCTQAQPLTPGTATCCIGTEYGKHCDVSSATPPGPMQLPSPAHRFFCNAHTTQMDNHQPHRQARRSCRHLPSPKAPLSTYTIQTQPTLLYATPKQLHLRVPRSCHQLPSAQPPPCGSLPSAPPIFNMSNLLTYADHLSHSRELALTDMGTEHRQHNKGSRPHLLAPRSCHHQPFHPRPLCASACPQHRQHPGQVLCA
jgi:hypothetical protein